MDTCLVTTHVVRLALTAIPVRERHRIRPVVLRSSLHSPEKMRPTFMPRSYRMNPLSSCPQTASLLVGSLTSCPPVTYILRSSYTHIVLNPLYHPRSGLVMNTFIHQNGSVTDRDNINNRQIHQDLHWLNIPERVSYRLCMLTHRCLLGKAPRYLSEYCVLVLMSPLPAFTIGSASPTDCTTTSTQHIRPTCICCRGRYGLQRYA